MGTFNRLEAVKYAVKWAKGRNPAFRDYGANHGGGDCTNFVSQVMLAGGWPMVLGPGWFSSNWWYRDGEGSRTWASANWFSMYLEDTPRTKQCKKEDLLPGDIVMMQGTQFPRPNHAMVVVRLACGLTSNQIYLAYHSTDTQERSLQSIQADYSSETKYWYWRVLDLFPEPEKVLREWRENRTHIGNKV